MKDDGTAELDTVGESNNESCIGSPATNGWDKASIILSCMERCRVSVKVRFRLVGLVSGGEVIAVTRLSFVGVRVDISESDSKGEAESPFPGNDTITGDSLSDRGWMANVGFLTLVGEELGLS
jgi:hypothetical protein